MKKSDALKALNTLQLEINHLYATIANAPEDELEQHKEKLQETSRQLDWKAAVIMNALIYGVGEDAVQERVNEYAVDIANEEGVALTGLSTRIRLRQEVSEVRTLVSEVEVDMPREFSTNDDLHELMVDALNSLDGFLGTEAHTSTQSREEMGVCWHPNQPPINYFEPPTEGD